MIRQKQTRRHQMRKAQIRTRILKQNSPQIQIIQGPNNRKKERFDERQITHKWGYVRRITKIKTEFC